MTKTPPPPPPYYPYLLACWLHLLGMLYVFARVHAAALAVSALSFSANAGRNNQHHRVRKKKKKKKARKTHSVVSAKDNGRRWSGTNAGMNRKNGREKKKHSPRIPP